MTSIYLLRKAILRYTETLTAVWFKAYALTWSPPSVKRFVKILTWEDFSDLLNDIYCLAKKFLLNLRIHTHPHNQIGLCFRRKINFDIKFREFEKEPCSNAEMKKAQVNYTFTIQ